MSILYAIVTSSPRACLKIAFWQMCVTICGRFAPNEGRISDLEQLKQLLCITALQCFEILKEYLLQSSGLCTFKKHMEDEEFSRKVKQAFEDSKRRYGAVKLCRVLGGAGTPCSIKRVQRHMAEQVTALCDSKEVPPPCQSWQYPRG